MPSGACRSRLRTRMGNAISDHASKTVLQSVLQGSFPGADLRTTISVAGTGKPGLRLV